MTGNALLDVRDLSVRYGGVTAVDEVNLAVPEGTIVGLIGPNGAGKTSLVDALSGFTRHVGDIVFQGQSISSLKPHQRARRGISRTFQSGGTFNDLTVEENVLIGERRNAGWLTRLAAVASGRSESHLSETGRVIAALGLESLLDRDVSGLTAGQLKLVAVARALVSQPRLVIMDEPAAGLDSSESAWLGERLGEVRDSGSTILLVEHDMELVQAVCDSIYVLDFGKIIASGTPGQVMTDPRVISAYLGDLGQPAETGIPQ